MTTTTKGLLPSARSQSLIRYWSYCYYSLCWYYQVVWKAGSNMPPLKRFERQIGQWAFVRFLRNAEVPFGVAHWIILGKAPRF